MQDIYDYIMSLVRIQDMLKTYLVFHPNRDFEYYVKRRLCIVSMYRNDNPISTVTMLPTDELYVYDESFGLHGLLHSVDDRPAITSVDGKSMDWYWYGRRHRYNGPAIITPTTLYYYMNDKLHRDNDLPAIECSDGNRVEYYKCGKLHREGGPAIITDTCREWWQYNILHRIGGPAKEYANGDYEYYVYGLLHRDMSEGPARKRANQLTYSEYGYVSSLTGSII